MKKRLDEIAKEKGNTARTLQEHCFLLQMKTTMKVVNLPLWILCQ